MTAATSCRTCGTAPREGARFCDSCGSPIAAGTERAEYKQVTVLFADVVHSMTIAAAVGAERLREVMAELADLCAAVVQRYGGTVDKFTGDGIMAVFGAPAALEDHAFRACLAALDVHKETQRLAAEVRSGDGIDLQLRVGLNSGQVIAGEIGSRRLGYTTIGEQVGLAQRMESVAPPGGVMLSNSTARLVGGAAVLGEPELVQVKGVDKPVMACRLVAFRTQPGKIGLPGTTLVGRDWESHTVASILDRSIGGHGCVVGVTGPPGIGKSRLVYEATALARRRGAAVFSTFCESHAADVPFHVAARLLRDVAGIADVDDETARQLVHTQVPNGSDEDVLLLHDLLGISNPDVERPQIDPDARRRRITALINSLSLARTDPALYVIEDVHWIDEVSESMLADFLTVVPQTRAMVLITYRPEYRGSLAHVSGSQTISLAPLTEAESAELLDELLGADPSGAAIMELIAERAAGNPFFVQEIVRELAERGVLEGHRGEYTCHTDISEVAVPVTVQAAIAARIDRLDAESKHTLNAAAVIGSHFTPELVATLGIDPVVDELARVELIDQIRFTPSAEYAFRHPLIRTVAYESQLKSDRAQLHRRLAAAIEQRDPGAADENAALIAEHLEAAGDLHAAYGWHMRAATWATNRDIAAARLGWERARTIADSLPADDPNRAAMRIAPRTMLCAIAFRFHIDVSGDIFDELRELCTAAGDKASLVLAMTGLVVDHAYHARIREATRLAEEAWELAESVGDPSLTVCLSTAAILAKSEDSAFFDMLRWSQRTIDLADGDPSIGNFIVGAPLALAYAQRGCARYCLGLPGWRDDQRHGLTMAEGRDAFSYTAAICFVYIPGIAFGGLRPDDHAMREIEEALRIAERSGDDLALALAWITLGTGLVHRPTDAERDRGHKFLAEACDWMSRWQYLLCEIPIVEVYLARETARRGDGDRSVARMRAAVDDLFRDGHSMWAVPTTGVLVETLLARGAAGDVLEAEAAIERLAAMRIDPRYVLHKVWPLRLQALLARARGDAAAYAHFRDRYRDMARSLEFEGHIDWAEAMP